MARKDVKKPKKGGKRGKSQPQAKGRAASRKRTEALRVSMLPAPEGEWFPPKQPLELPGPGRPTLYVPEYCDQLVAHMGEGLSFESFAGVVNVSKQTLYNWAEAHAEFLDAKERGVEKCRLWWERLGIQGVQGLGPRVLKEETQEAMTKDGELLLDPQGQVAIKTKKTYAAAQFVPGTWFRNMTNRFPQEWRERHELTGPDGQPLPPWVAFETLVKTIEAREGIAPGNPEGK